MSKRRMNKKGMTLVEIVIVLLIASIAMTITGGILINSLGYFRDTTELSTDKTAGDGLLDLIKSEIQYSTDVRVQVKNPALDETESNETDLNKTDKDDWHCFYVDNTQLYKDGSAVFVDEDGNKGDYYNNRNLDITVKGFNNGYRLDMTISLNKGTGTNKETKYKVSHTFEFLNLKTKKASNANFQNPFANIGNDDEPLSSTMKLWYIKDADKIAPDTDDGKKDDNNDTDSTGNGTVEDIILNIDTKNCLGAFQSGVTGGQIFKKGDIVWYDNCWWQAINPVNNDVPGTGWQKWKKLDKYYDNSSFYEQGDIVIFNDNYYRLKDKISENWYNPTDSWHWELIGSINDPEAVNTVKQKTYPKEYDRTIDTVVDLYLQNNSDDLRDPLKKKYFEFDSNKHYKDGDIIKMRSTDQENFYDLWIKKACFDTNKEPGTPDSGWIKLVPFWVRNSSYKQGNVVAYSRGGLDYIKAINDVLIDIDAHDDVYSDPHKCWDNY